MQQIKSKESRRLDMTGREKWTTGNCARNFKLTIRTSETRICFGKWDARSSLWFWDTNDSLNLGQTTRPRDIQQKRESAE